MYAKLQGVVCMVRTSFIAARATPWAWLPAEEQMTPFCRCSGVRLAILLYAPLSLKENTCNSLHVRPVKQICAASELLHSNSMHHMGLLTTTWAQKMHIDALPGLH